MQTASSPGMRRRIIWSIAALIVISLLGLGVFNAVTLPGCASCHERDGFRAATEASAHAKVDCASCHVPADAAGRIAFSLRQPLHMFLPTSRGAERDAAAVPDARCLRCHAKVLTTVSATVGVRIAHKTCAAGAACTDCHSATAHGTATSWVRTYEMDRCLVCHVTDAQTKCDLCHEGRTRERRALSGGFAVTHGPQWRSTHGMGDPATCSVCHDAGDCVRCHGPGLPHGAAFLETHAEVAAARGAKCASCHAESFCDACHRTPMPHPAQFTAGHARSAAEQPATCKRCHAESDCTTCHAKHVHPGGAVGGARPSGVGP